VGRFDDAIKAGKIAAAAATQRIEQALESLPILESMGVEASEALESSQLGVWEADPLSGNPEGWPILALFLSNLGIWWIPGDSKVGRLASPLIAALEDDHSLFHGMGNGPAVEVSLPSDKGELGFDARASQWVFRYSQPWDRGWVPLGDAIERQLTWWAQRGKTWG